MFILIVYNGYNQLINNILINLKRKEFLVFGLYDFVEIIIILRSYILIYSPCHSNIK